jgi:hypothetical protein
LKTDVHKVPPQKIDLVHALLQIIKPKVHLHQEIQSGGKKRQVAPLHLHLLKHQNHLLHNDVLDFLIVHFGRSILRKKIKLV